MYNLVFDRIAVKLVCWLLLFSAFLAVATAGIQVYFDHQRQLVHIDTALNSITQNRLHEVEKGLRENDSNLLNNLLDAFLLQSGVAYAAIVVDEKVAWQRGEKNRKNNHYKDFSVHVKSDSNQNTTLQLATEMNFFSKDVLARFLKILLTNGVSIFLIAGFVFIMFQYLVTNHLESLAKQVQQIDCSQDDSSINLNRKSSTSGDELDLVVSGLNDMHQRAFSAIKTLAENEKKLLLFFDSTEEAILGVDREGVCSFANKSCLKLMGLQDVSEIVGLSWDELIHYSRISNQRVVKSPMDSIVLQSIKEAQPKIYDDGVLQAALGRSCFVRIRCYPIFEDGEVSGAVAFIKDITKTRQIQKEQALLSDAIKQLPVMILIADHHSMIQYVNSGTERLTGFSRQELLGQPLYNFRKLSFAGDWDLEDIKDILLRGKQWEGVVETQSKWGSKLKFFSIVSPVLNEKGEMVNTITVCREISYELALQNELVNSKKMEALHRLSASFAHEFGNPLYGVNALLQDFRARLEVQEKDKELLNLAIQECETLEDILKEFQLNYHSSKDGDTYCTIDRILNGVIKELTEKMQAANVTCELILTDAVAGHRTSKAKLSLVVRNIMTNAIESMEGKGGTLQLNGILDDGCLHLTIGDMGAGIKKEYQDLVLEPFFSTKQNVEGVGLGLPIAYSALQSIGGTLSFSSDEGDGAVFTVCLPLV